MTARTRLDANAIALALLTSVLWGGNVIAVKLGLEDLPPFRLGWMRFTLGGLSVLGWAWVSRASLRFGRAERPILLFIGLLFAIQIGLFHLGTRLTTAGNTSVLTNVNALHVVLLAHFFVPGDRLTARKLLAVLVAYAGVLCVFIPRLSGGEGSLAGDLINSVVAILLAVRTIALNRAVQRVEPPAVLLAQVGVGVPLFLLLDLFLERGVATRYTFRMAVAVAYQGIAVSGFNFVAYLWLLKRYQPSVLAPFSLTTPLFGVLLSRWILGEPLTGYLLAGATLVAIGIGLVTFPAGKARPR